MRKTWWLLLLIIILSLPVVHAYIGRGYPATDDGFWAVVRQAEMHREIKDLQIPPRWSGYLNHGYGYPLFLFTYPLPYYVGELIYVAGVGVIATVKLLFIGGTILSGVAMFLFTRRLFGASGGIIAAVLYLYAPYKLLNLTVRGSLGEVVASIFFPLLFLLFQKLIETPSRLLLLATSMSVAGFILTHNASVVLFMPFLGLWIIYLLIQKKSVLHKQLPILGATFGIALLVTAFFWLPAVIEKKFIALSVIPLTNRSEQFLTLNEFIGSDKHAATGLPLGIGTATLGIAILGFFAVQILVKKLAQKNTVYFFVASAFLSLSMLFKFSDPLWQLPLLAEIDFPWRMLGVSIFFLSILGAGLATTKLRKYFAFGVPCILFFIVILPTFGVARHFAEDSYFETNDGTTTSNDELMPVWAQEKPTNRPQQFVRLSSMNGSVLDYHESSQTINFTVLSTEPTTVTLEKLYFPGWHTYANGREILPINRTEKTGLMSFYLSPGENTVELKFENTQIRQIANLLSIVGMIVFVFLCFQNKIWSRWR